MFFRRKKKRVNDENQLLLFTMEEMKGGKESSSQPDSSPSSDGSDEGLPDKQAPVIASEQTTEETPSEENTKSEESISPKEDSKTDNKEVVVAEPDQSPLLKNSGLYSVDHRQMLQAMRRAIQHLSSLSIKDIRLIAIESATYAQGGIDTDQTYTLQALNGQELSGYDFIAYYYVSFARSFPSMLDKIDLPYSDIYEEALSLGIS